MYTIEIPSDISITLPGLSKPHLFSFQNFVNDRLDDAKIFGVNADSIFASIRMKLAFRDCSGGDTVTVESADFPFLKSAVDTPTKGYNPAVVTQVPDYLNAVLKASEG